LSYVMSLGEEILDKPEETIRKLARLGLAAVKPTRLITDYGIGWNDVVLDEAKKMGIPYIGVMPYKPDNPAYNQISKGAASNLVFCGSKEEFIKNPYPYIEWVKNYVGEFFLYLDPEKLNFKKTIIRAAPNIRIRNIFMEAQ